MLLPLIGVLYIAFGLHVNNRLTADDITAIAHLNVTAACETTDTYDAEITCIGAIQRAVQSIGARDCAGYFTTIEPAAFIASNYGCCFDRARFIEKAARYYGFETRHVFMIAPKGGRSVTNLIPLNQDSQATSEILTTRGWLGVDSNDDFMLLSNRAGNDGNNGENENTYTKISDAGTPHTYKYAIQNLAKFTNINDPDFYHAKPDILYGLYSRHGFFFGPNLPGPEFNAREVLYNADG